MKIIFTDLDGTLLDHDDYLCHNAKYALELIKKRKIPLVFCTSKTSSEIKYWRKKIGNIHPFISENGGGVFVPKNYFSFVFDYDLETDDYFVVEFGTKIKELQKVFDDLQKRFKVVSFFDMSIEEIAEDTGLDFEQARLAQKREYVLPFKVLKPEEKRDILEFIAKLGLNVTVGGRFYHLMGDNTKGKSVCFLSGLFEKEFMNIVTIGLGDSKNDFSMLENVDKGFLVKKKEGYASDNYLHAGGEGPVGWNIVVKKELE